MMNRKVLFWPLAAMLLTACEKGLVDGVADVAPAGQAANSVLQVRTRSGGSAGEEATQFRIWATQVLKEYLTKGFVLDDERLKGKNVFGADYFDDLLDRIREIRISERRYYQKIRGRSIRKCCVPE